VNPGVAVPTGDVFARLKLKPGGPRKRAIRVRRLPKGLDGLIDFLSTQGNDLERPAMALRPVIGRVLRALRKEHGCRLARMSGSGATCFGLFESARAARTAALRIKTSHPGRWVSAANLR